MTDHEWVGKRLDVRLADGLTDFAGLAVRRNPKRAHLVVSQVLGKHIPVDPRLAYAAARMLGERVAQALGGIGRPRPLSALTAALRGESGALAGLAYPPDDVARLDEPPLVIGYAETATALGHAVADAFAGARYLHSTRRSVAGFTPLGTFEEVHSHATEHLLLPADPAWLADPAPVVLVDDELTTGRTAAATIRALHAIHPRRRYVVAALLDLRTDGYRPVLADAAAELGTRIDVVSLATGTVDLPPDVLERGAALVAELDAAPARGPVPSGLTSEATGARREDGTGKAPGPAPAKAGAKITALWPTGLPSGGRHGFAPADRGALRDAVAALADEVAGDLPERGTVLVLGSEELMYTPLLLAAELARRRGPVRFSSTTRSPVLPVDEPGYAIRTRLEFEAHDGIGGTRFVHNVAGGGFAGIVLVVDTTADTPQLWGTGGLVEALRHTCDTLTVAVVPA